METWKDIPEYEGYYQVSNLGNVKALSRIVYKNDNTIQTFKEKIKSCHLSSNGYPSVSLCKEGKSRMYNIHSLIAKAFLDKDYIKKKMVVNHKDGNKQNSILDNIEVVSHTDNLLHAHANRLNSNFGETHTNSILTNEQVKNIRMEIIDKPYYGQLSALAKKYNVKESVISGIKRRKSWKSVTL